MHIQNMQATSAEAMIIYGLSEINCGQTADLVPPTTKLYQVIYISSAMMILTLLT